MTFYAGLDVHKEFINAAVVNSRGRVVKEAKFMNTPQALNAFLTGLDGQTEFALEAYGFYEPVYDRIDDRGWSTTDSPKKGKGYCFCEKLALLLQAQEDKGSQQSNSSSSKKNAMLHIYHAYRKREYHTLNVNSRGKKKAK